MIWIQTIITFLIGYALGNYAQNPKSMQNAVRKAKRKITKQRIGAIKNISAEEALKTTTEKEEEEEMERVLDSVL